MSNHPDRSKFKNPASRPPPEAVAAYRKMMKQTQREAAEVIYATESAWRAWENGERPMHAGHWELYKIKSMDGPTLRALGLSPLPFAPAPLASAIHTATSAPAADNTASGLTR